MRSGLLAAQFRQQLLHDNFLVERPLDTHCLLIRLVTLAAQDLSLIHISEPTRRS